MNGESALLALSNADSAVTRQQHADSATISCRGRRASRGRCAPPSRAARYGVYVVSPASLLTYWLRKTSACTSVRVACTTPWATTRACCSVLAATNSCSTSVAVFRNSSGEGVGHQRRRVVDLLVVVLVGPRQDRLGRLCRRVHARGRIVAAEHDRLLRRLRRVVVAERVPGEQAAGDQRQHRDQAQQHRGGPPAVEQRRQARALCVLRWSRSALCVLRWLRSALRPAC